MVLEMSTIGTSTRLATRAAVVFTPQQMTPMSAMIAQKVMSVLEEPALLLLSEQSEMVVTSAL